jgi:hypothetical protein
VTGDSLSLQQKDPSADQYGSLPMVVENCPSEQKEYTVVIGFEPFWSQCTYALKQALCAPNSDAKSWEPWSFTEGPDCPQAQAPNIISIPPKKGDQINLKRNVPFPEPSFTCLSKVPVNEPPTGSPTRAPTERVAHFQNLLLHVSRISQ